MVFHPLQPDELRQVAPTARRRRRRAPGRARDQAGGAGRRRRVAALSRGRRGVGGRAATAPRRRASPRGRRVGLPDLAPARERRRVCWHPLKGNAWSSGRGRVCAKRSCCGVRRPCLAVGVAGGDSSRAAGGSPDATATPAPAGPPKAAGTPGSRATREAGRDARRRQVRRRHRDASVPGDPSHPVVAEIKIVGGDDHHRGDRRVLPQRVGRRSLRRRPRSPGASAASGTPVWSRTSRSSPRRSRRGRCVSSSRYVSARR